MKLKDRFIFRLVSDLRARLRGFEDYLQDQDFFWRLVDFLEKAKGWLQAISPIVDFFYFLAGLISRAMTVYMEYNSSFLVLFVVYGHSFAVLAFEKLVLVGVVGSFYFKYPGLLLWAIFFTFMSTFLGIAKFFFFSFITLSYVKYFFWALFSCIFYLFI
jgi:hypothetical protein